MQYAGKDITNIMRDSLQHLHSDSAYEMLHDFYIGELLTEKNLLQNDSYSTSAPTSKKPYGTASRKEFIDVTKPMLSQIYNGNFTKAFYLEQVSLTLF
jgi:4-hydroxysphinganine ceramide fatty acyl 2-hydroxylase